MKTTMKKTAAYLLAMLLVFQTLPAMADATISGTQGPITSYREKLRITAVTSTLTVGMEIQLTATENYNAIKWESEDPEIAAVDENGKVTALAAGTARITANDSGHTDSITLRVIGTGTDTGSESGKEKGTDEPVRTGKMIIIINGTKDKVTYDGLAHTTGYIATSNSDSFDESRLHLINEDHLASGVDCNVYQDTLTADDFTYDGEEAEFVISNGWLQIKPAQVTVIAEDKKKAEGAPDPELTATVTGVLQGEDPAQIHYTLKTETRNGTTRIIPECDSIQGNYRVSAVEGEMIIMKERPLYNLASIGSTWYRLAKTKIWTDTELVPQNLGKELPSENYYAEKYDFTDLVITVDGKEYVYQCEKNAEAILLGANYYTASLSKVEMIKNKIGGLDSNKNPRWLVPASQQYNDSNEVDSYHRNYNISLHENTAAIDDQEAYTMLAIEGGDNNYYRLKKTPIKAKAADKVSNGTILKSSEYVLTPYNFTNVKLNIDGTEYIYSADGKEDETVSYFTVRFEYVQKLGRINNSRTWFENEAGWQDGAKAQYGSEKNETPGYHANYRVRLHKGQEQRKSVTIRSNWPEGKIAYTGAKITLSATLEGFGENVRLQWQRSTDLEKWEDISGATGMTYTYTLDDTTVQYSWRVTADE